MSSENATSDSNDGGQEQGFTPPATQDDLNRIISDRIERERKKFADYDDLKAAAESIESIKEAHANEIKQAKDEAAAIAAELAGLKQQGQIQSWANEIAAEVGVPASVLRGASKDELLSHAQAVKAELDASRQQRPSPNVSKTPPALNSSALEDSLRKVVGAN